MQAKKAKIKIVIADDNPNIRITLHDILTHKGYVVESVNDGYELLAYLMIKKANIIILDLMMPERDGLEALSSIKSISPDTKIIIYTAFQRYKDSSYIVGVDKFLLKSEGTDKLCEAIEELE